MKVLPVSVFRDARLPGDYTNGGVSAAYDELFLVGPPSAGRTSPTTTLASSASSSASSSPTV